jgi:hypothetical protein
MEIELQVPVSSNGESSSTLSRILQTVKVDGQTIDECFLQ